jgi:hypothetical protein
MVFGEKKFKHITINDKDQLILMSNSDVHCRGYQYFKVQNYLKDKLQNSSLEATKIVY